MELSSYVADIDGHQRKVVSVGVRPVSASHGTEGLPVRDGRTLPFRLYRAWNAPAGYYEERWYIVDPSTREVLHEGPPTPVRIWGLQSWTDLTDEVTEPVELVPARYLLVFALSGVMGAEIEIEAAEVPQDSAA